MRGRLKDLTINRDGSQNVTITVNSDFRQVYDGLAGVDLDVEIKKHRAKRSLDSNGYAWTLIDKIAAETGIDKVTVYQETIRNIGGVSDIVCAQDRAVEALRSGWESKGIGWITETLPSKLEGCTNIVLYYGSSTYDTAQMSRLIDKLVAEAKDLGIETATPQELARLREEWEKHQGR